MSTTHNHDLNDDIKKAHAITWRALAGTDATIAFGTETVADDGPWLRLPEPPDSTTQHPAWRGGGDAEALKLRHHNTVLHAQLAPVAGLSRAVFDVLEQARVQALGAKNYIGVAHNLRDHLSARCVTQGLSDPVLNFIPPLPEALRILAPSLLAGFDFPQGSQALQQHWLNWIAEKSPTCWQKLQHALHSQTLFAKVVIDVLHEWHLEHQAPDKKADERAGEEHDESTLTPHDAPETLGEQQSDDNQNTNADQTSMAGASTETIADRLVDNDDDTAQPSPHTAPPPPLGHNGPPSAYRSYTTEFDEVIEAEKLCSTDELQRLRQQLDAQMQPYRHIVARLAGRLQRKLQASQLRSFYVDLEEGQLNPKRLSRVITNPFGHLAYRRERTSPFRDTVVSLLIDNSGSMRGRPIMLAALSADIMAQTLERCGVRSEILGFTTRSWKGGQSREAWMKMGKIPHPGRLNDVRHIIYKAADAPMRRARQNMGLMLREGLLKENIDGEALQWAWQRLQKRPEQRLILMVISDGAPVDDSTLSVNSSHYLEQHLRDVINHIQARRDVELVAIGIGHDVGRYYQRAVTLSDADQLGGAMVDQLAQLFDDTGEKSRRRA